MGKLFSKTKRKVEKSACGPYSSCTAQSVDLQFSDTSMARKLIHQDAIVSLAAVQPGLCLSGSKDKTVVLYDYHNSRVEDRWTGHEREVTKVKYGSACHGVFSASRDKSVKMWHRGNSHPVQDFIGHELVVTAIDLNGDNTRLCTGSRDNTLRLFDIETGSCLLENNIPQNLITDIKWIPNSELAVQVGEDKDVRLLDLRNLNVVHTFTKKQYIQMCCDVSSDGNFCLTCSNGFGGNGCEATLFDLRSRTLVHEFKGHLEAIEACLFLPNSGQPLIATASRDCTVKIWNRDTKDLVTELGLSGAGPLTSLLAFEDGSILVGSFNLGVVILDLKDGMLKVKSQF